MVKRLTLSARQILFLSLDLDRAVNRRPWRLISVPFSGAFAAIASYRISRALFLLLGPSYKVLRTILAPLTFLLRPWTGGIEIHYEADVAGGLQILHPSLGAVISKYAVIGANLTLTGGNCVGGRRPLRRGEIWIGDDVFLGANASVLGPIRVGDRVNIGAGAVAVRDIPDDTTVTGVPATPRMAPHLIRQEWDIPIEV